MALSTDFRCRLYEWLTADHEKYRLCIDLAKDVGSAVFRPDEFVHIIRKVYDSFYSEHGLGTAHTKSINRQYIAFIEKDTIGLKALLNTHQDKFQQSFVQTILRTSPLMRRHMFIDLLHMHVNRLFAEHQRTHEMIIYNFLIKEWMKQSAVNNKVLFRHTE